MGKKIIISGGGTGGHIFPAISIANALRQLDKNVEILFVGARGRMEMEKVPAAGYNIIGLPIAGFQRRLTFENVLFFFRLIRSLMQASKIIKSFRPGVVVGVGGYASGPVLRMASMKKIPIVIQEQNSYAGVTNKLLAKKAARIFVAYDGMEKYFPKDKIIKSGNPVRQDLNNVKDKREEALSYFGLQRGKKTILALGGSLGARTINHSITADLAKIASSGYQLIWQCGKIYHEEAKKSMTGINASNIKLNDFISRMDLAYAAADIIISRAGAGSISELCLVGKPVILVPSPNVAEDHQTKNALALADKNAAVLIKDAEAKTKLVDEALALIADEKKCQSLSEAVSAMAIRNSAVNIAKEILTLIPY